MHIPVMMTEILEAFKGKSLSTFVDATVGLGGHSRAILSQHPEIKQLIGIDQDPNALQQAASNLAEFQEKVKLIHSNFHALSSLITTPVDGILIDLGVSSMQLDVPERGFSFRFEGPLDMRMNPHDDLTAADIVNTWRKEDLENIFYEYGEEHRSRKIAAYLVESRRKHRFTTTQELADAVAKVIPRTGKIHPATRVFQALRIAVNRELGVLQEVLPQAIDLLAPGGRLAVISFHSLEDRIVKEAFKRASHIEHKVTLITKKPLVPTYSETKQNPRSRSSKLRICEKLLIR